MRVSAVRGVARALLVLSTMAVTRGEAAPSCQELNRLWRTKYHAGFGVTWALEEFACPSAQSRFAKAIYDVASPEFTPNKSGYAPDFYNWVTTLVKQTRYSPTLEPSSVESAATMSEHGTMTLHDPYFNKIDDVWRAGTIIHEAAHALPTDSRHVVCTHGDRAGITACDEKLHETFAGSGYNFQFVYYMWLRDGASYGELAQSVIQEVMKNLALNRFNEVTATQVTKYAGASDTALAEALIAELLRRELARRRAEAYYQQLYYQQHYQYQMSLQVWIQVDNTWAWQMQMGR